jgi:flavin reductase (DIM6/NTAB) family NADH-FMN oxidoreductase RutF
MDQVVTKSNNQETPDHFVQAMAAAAFGVSIVTTQGATGKLGLTVACINRKNVISDAITKNKSFAVNMLSELQASLAKTFAGRPEQGLQAYDFTQGTWSDEEGAAPVLLNSAANFICHLESFHDAGTHRIFIGRVLEAQHNGALPLVYSHRKFGKFLSL